MTRQLAVASIPPRPAFSRAWIAWLALLSVTSGCGAKCAEVAARREALLQRTSIAPGPHAQVRIPFARANELIASLVHDQPIRSAIPMPSLGPFTLKARELTAVAREVALRPAAADHMRFAIRIEIEDDLQPVTTLTAEVEVRPVLVRTADGSELVAGFGPDNLHAVRPVLGPESGRAMGDAITRWMPPAIRDRLPRAAIDGAARQLGEYLTGGAYQMLRATLLRRLGERTQLRLRLPALPIASTAIASTAEAMTVDLTTDLRVRAGLVPGGAPASDDIAVRISASAAAELANWSIAHGHAPQHYTRGLEPRADGEYRPIFDYVADQSRRPLKLHVFQDRGGCSCFQVGLRFQIRIVDDKLEIITLDRLVEYADASLPLEIGLWLKQLIQGPIDRAYRAAAHTQLAIAGRRLRTRVVRAAMTDGAIDLALAIAATPSPQLTQPAVR